MLDYVWKPIIYLPGLQNQRKLLLPIPSLFAEMIFALFGLLKEGIVIDLSHQNLIIT